MKATFLVDNIANDELRGEWGLSVYIEYGEKKVLLDVGASDLFFDNANVLGIDLEQLDYAVLSHAHYDHADGMRIFFAHNTKTKFYIQKGCKENCYAKKWIFHKYIGIPKGILEEDKDRFVYASADYILSDGLYLIPHKTKGLSEIGKRECMYRKENGTWVPDDFVHEQSLVVDTAKGLVIFNSCSHGGADNIINEVAATFPDKKVYALIGGFHLFNKSEDTVRAFAKRVKETGIECIYTGHCTGKRAYRILKSELGDVVHQISTGLQIEL